MSSRSLVLVSTLPSLEASWQFVEVIWNCIRATSVSARVSVERFRADDS